MTIQEENLQSRLGRFKKLKKYNLLLADSYKRLSKEKKYIRVKDCGTFLEFKKFENGQVFLSGANFCKDRLCPACAKRRSLKVFGQLSKVLNDLKQYNYKYLFVTLTLKNCRRCDLDVTLDLLSKGFTKFTKTKHFRNKVFCGAFRSTEITRNKEQDTFHPHLHLLVAVKQNYFSINNKNYMQKEDLVKVWRRCLDIDYDPICDIRAVKNTEKVSFEVSKYITKGSDFLYKDDEKTTDELVELLSVSLHSKRFISYVGCFFKSRQKLRLHDKDIEKNINIDEIESCEELAYIVKKFRWNFGFSGYEEF